MHKGWFGHGSVCTVETLGGTLGIVLVCRSETSVEQLGIDCETAKAAQDTMEAVLGELACNHEVGGQRYNSAPIGIRSSRLEQHAYE